MNTLQLERADSPSLWQHSTGDLQKPELGKVIAHLTKEAARGLDSRTILCRRTECEAVVAMIDGRAKVLPREPEAIECAKTLLGMYPARHVHDAETYSHALKTVFMHWEIDFVRRVVDPVNGLPSRLPHLPTIAEVTKALEQERTRRQTIRNTAAWMIRQHDARAAEGQTWNLTPERMAQRRRQVQELLTPKGMEANS